MTSTSAGSSPPAALLQLVVDNLSAMVAYWDNEAYSCTSARPAETRGSSRLHGATLTIEIADSGCGPPSEVPRRVVKAPSGSALGSASGGETQPARRRPGPRVLVVDDEPAVAKTLARILANSCEVIVCTHSPRALQLLLDHDEPPFALIFCDLMMPELGGEALYYQVAGARPDLARRFVLTTGGAFTPDGRRFMQGAPVPMLDKPFDLKRLSEILAPHISPGE